MERGLTDAPKKSHRPQPGRILGRYTQTLLIFWVIILSVLYATLSILRHQRFESGGFDLGLYDQAIWQYSRFLWPYNTVKDRFILGDHLTLTLPLLAPLYWLWDDVRFLLIFQAVWISASTIAIYLTARLRKFSPWVSLVVSVLYSLFYGIQYAVFFDFHPVVLGVGLAAWLIYFLEAQKKLLTIFTTVLLLLTQENMGLLLAALGIIYFWRREFRGTAIILVIVGIVSSVVGAKIIALFSPGGFQYWPMISTNPAVTFKQFFDTGEKRQVWLYTLAWFSFLPLASPGAMLAVFFDLAQYFVSGPEFSRMWSPFMHHRISLAPLVTLGTLEALERFRGKINLNWLATFLLVAAVGQQYFFHLPLNKLTKPAFWQKEGWARDNQAIMKLIPAGAKLATQQSLIPHLSHRQYIYLAWPRLHDFDEEPCGQRSCWWLDFDQKAELLLIDLHPGVWLTQLLESGENFTQALDNMEKSGKITLERAIGNTRLYRIRY